MQNKISLYQLSEEAKVLEEIFESCIDSETGEILEGEVIDELGKELAVAIQSKSTAIIQVYKNQVALIPAIDEEIKRFTAMKKLAVNNNERFESYIKMCMIKLDVDKIETPLGTISLRKSKQVIITDEKLIPEKFKTRTEEIKISKVDIKKAIENKEVVTGATIQENLNFNLK